MIAVLVENTVFSEKNFALFSELNRRSKNNDGIMLYLNLSTHIMHADFAIMNITEMYHMYGHTLLATCPNTAALLNKSAVNAKKAYYIWDLSFLLKPFSFNEMYDRLAGLTLITRSEDHKRIISDTFNLDSVVIPKFGDEIWTLFQ